MIDRLILDMVRFTSAFVLMRLDVLNNFRKYGRLHRAIALFFLLFTFADLTLADMIFPQLCGEGLARLTWSDSALTEDCANEAAARIAADQQKQDSHSDDDCTQDECFCCCSHVLIRARVNLGALDLEWLPVDAKLPFIPLAPSKGTFHPPRLS